MKVAVLSDIHGNYIAFEACLDYALQRKADAFIFLGDYVGELAYPRKTMEMLYELAEEYPCYFIRGNKEDYWLNYHDYGSGQDSWRKGSSTTGMLYYDYHELNQRDIAFFRGLPGATEISFEGFPTLTACHGSPKSVKQKMLPNDEQTLAIMEKSPTDIILCGHTHRQGKICHIYQENDNDAWIQKQVLNAGSVGMPLQSKGKAQFMFLHGEEGQWREEFVSLDYDRERVVEELFKAGLFEIAPGWSRVTRHVLYQGEPSHGAVLARAMMLCEEQTGVCIWPKIDECYWEQALKEMQVN